MHTKLRASLSKHVTHSQVSDIGVVAVLPDTLHGPWMGRHQVLTRLNKFFPVVWINPAPEWRNAWCRASRSSEAMSTRIYSHHSGIDVLNPGKWLPKFYRPAFLANVLEYIKIRIAIRHLKLKGCQKIVLYLTRPEQFFALKLYKYNLSCYHVFDEYSFSDTETAHDPVEVNLIRSCNIPFFSSEIMLNEKGGYNTNSVHLPNGVNYQWFSEPKAEPPDIADIPHPRIGYSGVIKKQLDLNLIYQLARQKNNWSFVFVGPVMNIEGFEGTLEKLKSLSNFYFLGPKDVQQLPAYIQYFDIGIMCYVKNNYTRYITPLKLNEYMACGINVVATDLEPLLPYEKQIAIVKNKLSWEAAITKSLEHEDMSDKIEMGRKKAREYDWDKLIIFMRDRIISEINKLN